MENQQFSLKQLLHIYFILEIYVKKYTLDIHVSFASSGCFVINITFIHQRKYILDIQVKMRMEES